MDGTAETAHWKDLLLRLPGVLVAEFRLDGAQVREVHILSDQSRGAKQIVRDVQSAMLTRFQMELDHRIISVAQIPGAMQAHCRRVVCQRLELSVDRCQVGDVTVCLALDEREYTGQTRCDLSFAGRLRAIVLATIDALNQLLSPGYHLSAEDVRRSPMGERYALLVGLVLKQGGRREHLLGACYEGEDANFSAVLATLDAVNRRLPALHAGTEGIPPS